MTRSLPGGCTTLNKMHKSPSSSPLQPPHTRPTLQGEISVCPVRTRCAHTFRRFWSHTHIMRFHVGDIQRNLYNHPLRTTALTRHRQNSSCGIPSKEKRQSLICQRGGAGQLCSSHDSLPLGHRRRKANGHRRLCPAAHHWIRRGSKTEPFVFGDFALRPPGTVVCPVPS